jgi:hypothetical protein
MRAHQVRTLAWSFGCVTLLGLASCGDNPTAPSPAPNPSVTPPTVTVVGLELEAPESIAPGSSAQLTVRERKSDGSSEDVTSRAQWSSTETRAIQVDASGVASALAAGESRITARFNNRTATNVVLALPPGTYRLTGRISDAGTPLGGVTLQVIEGTGQGATAVSNSGGGYGLYGVAGSIKIHGKRSNFENLIFSVHVASNTNHDVEMAVERPRDPIGGSYTLTVGATGCGSIPSEFQLRRYDAQLVQRGAELTVTLSGADFLVSSGRGNQFRGSYNPDGRIVFNLGSSLDYYYYYSTTLPDLVEQVTQSSVLVINGNAIAHHDGNGIIAGTIGGSFALSNRMTYPHWPYSSNCFNGRHRFELRRK